MATSVSAHVTGIFFFFVFVIKLSRQGRYGFWENGDVRVSKYESLPDLSQIVYSVILTIQYESCHAQDWDKIQIHVKDWDKTIISDQDWDKI